VENIPGAKGEGICPFERLASGISDPLEVYRRLKVLHCSLRQGK